MRAENRRPSESVGSGSLFPRVSLKMMKKKLCPDIFSVNRGAGMGYFRTGAERKGGLYVVFWPGTRGGIHAGCVYFQPCFCVCMFSGAPAMPGMNGYCHWPYCPFAYLPHNCIYHILSSLVDGWFVCCDVWGKMTFETHSRPPPQKKTIRLCLIFLRFTVTVARLTDLLVVCRTFGGPNQPTQEEWTVPNRMVGLSEFFSKNLLKIVAQLQFVDDFSWSNSHPKGFIRSIDWLALIKTLSRLIDRLNDSDFKIWLFDWLIDFDEDLIDWLIGFDEDLIDWLIDWAPILQEQKIPSIFISIRFHSHVLISRSYWKRRRKYLPDSRYVRSEAAAGPGAEWRQEIVHDLRHSHCDSVRLK